MCRTCWLRQLRLPGFGSKGELGLAPPLLARLSSAAASLLA